MKAGIIGVSGFGEVHYNDLLDYAGRGELEVAAATIINQDEEADKCETLRGMGCAIFADYRTMLAEFAGGLDVCFIPTGIAMHAPMAIAAMDSGANCLIEKPAAPTVQDVESMRLAEKRNGRFTAVGFQAIYLPEILELKRSIVGGRLGRLRRVGVLGLWPRDSAYYSRNGWAGRIRDSRGDLVLDSPYNNALAHYLNLACFLAGTEVGKSAELATARACLIRCNPEIENADTAVIQLKSTNGVEMLFHATHCSEETFGPLIKIEGDGGAVETDMRTITYKIDGERPTVVEIDNDKLRTNIMDAVLGRVSDPSRFICDLDIAGTHTLAVNGAHESSPVVPLAAKRMKRLETESGTRRYVCEGVDEAMKSLFDDNSAEVARIAPELSMGREFDLTGYREFSL